MQEKTDLNTTTPYPKVSVIIPTYGDWQTLPRCLAALQAQDFPVGDFEIIIANNNESPLVPDDLILPANAHVVHVTMPGSYAARNAAIALSRGQIVAFTDADCIPSPQWLSEGVHHMQQDGINLVAGCVRFVWKGERPSVIELYDSVFNLRQESYVKKGSAATANLFVSRDVFDQYGHFDAKRFSGGDMEFTQRATSQGAKLVYASNARIDHPARTSFKEVIRKARRTTGAGILQKRRDDRKLIFPHIARLFPSIKAMRRIFQSGQTTFFTGIAVWFIYYAVDLVRVAEQVKLIVLKGGYERQ